VGQISGRSMLASKKTIIEGRGIEWSFAFCVAYTANHGARLTNWSRSTGMGIDMR